MKHALLLCILSVSAYTQVSGSVVIYEMTPQGFFVAADSRISSFAGLPKDDHCKISAISNRLVFAATGGTGYPAQLRDFASGWDAAKEADNALQDNLAARSPQPDITHQIEAIADHWSGRLVVDWSVLALVHPERVEEVARHENGILTNGIFAMSDGRSVGMVGRSIKRDTNGIIYWEAVPIAALCPVGHPCAAGETGIFLEFLHRSSERAKAERLPDDPMRKLKRLVELTIEYDDTGLVGGSVCSLRLTPEGVSWLDNGSSSPE